MPLWVAKTDGYWWNGEERGPWWGEEEVRVFPTVETTGLVGVGLTEGDLTEYVGTPSFGSGTVLIENKIINGDPRIFGTAQVTIRRCKINGHVDADSATATLLIEDTVIDSSTWTNATAGFQNVTYRRCDVRGGATGINASLNSVVEDSIMHEGYLPETGDIHMGGFLCSGGHNILVNNCTIICNNPLNVDGGGPSGTAQIYGDFAELYDITFDHCFFAATTGSYVTSFGYNPGWPESGKLYGDTTHDITVKNCVYERGLGGIYKGGTVATVTSWPALDPGSVWFNNTWDDDTPIDSDAQEATMTRPFEFASPPTVAVGDTDACSLGVEFYVSEPAELTHIHFWQPATGSPSVVTRKVALYSTTTGLTGTQVVAPENLPVSGSGWQSHTLSSSFVLTPGTRYRAVVYHPGGQYVATSNYFSTGGPGYGVGLGVIYDSYLTLPSSTDALNSNQMSFIYGQPDIAFPTQTFNSGNYWIDITVKKTALTGFVAHDGSEWVQAYGWAHNGTEWVQVSSTEV